MLSEIVVLWTAPDLLQVSHHEWESVILTVLSETWQGIVFCQMAQTE